MEWSSTPETISFSSPLLLRSDISSCYQTGIIWRLFLSCECEVCNEGIVYCSMSLSSKQFIEEEPFSQYELDSRYLIKDFKGSHLLLEFKGKVMKSRILTPLSIENIEISSGNMDCGSEGDETDMTQILQNFHCSYKELVSRLVQANTNDLFVLVRVNNQPQPPSTPRKEECSRPLEGFLTPNPVKTNHLREFSDQIREFHSDNVSPPINDRGTFESCE